jgi:hypothetical protein
MYEMATDLTLQYMLGYFYYGQNELISEIFMTVFFIIPGTKDILDSPTYNFKAYSTTKAVTII